jgi:hypothetical protein
MTNASLMTTRVVVGEVEYLPGLLGETGVQRQREMVVVGIAFTCGKQAIDGQERSTLIHTDVAANISQSQASLAC